MTRELTVGLAGRVVDLTLPLGVEAEQGEGGGKGDGRHGGFLYRRILSTNARARHPGRATLPLAENRWQNPLKRGKTG